jgi:hypothetical protein
MVPRSKCWISSSHCPSSPSRRYGAQSEILAIMRHEKNVETAANLDLDLGEVEGADSENGRGMKRR